MAKCAVVDRTNWKCSLEGFDNLTVAFVDGKYLNESGPYVKHVARYEWLMADAPFGVQ